MARSRQLHEIFVIECQPAPSRHWIAYWEDAGPGKAGKALTGFSFPEMRKICRRLDAKRPADATWPKYRVAAYQQDRERTGRLQKWQRS